MREGDKVMVKWSGREEFKDGPHELVTNPDYEGDVQINMDSHIVMVPEKWCEPVEPELEKGRMYYLWDDGEEHHMIIAKPPFTAVWDHIEPVHRRWDEWTDEEVERFVRTLGYYREDGVNAVEVMKAAYNFITGEEHP